MLKLITKPQNVTNELLSYGIPEAYLTEAVKRGYSARNNATSNDPPSTAGNYAFFATVRAIRELFIPKGWEKINKHNLCYTVNVETKVAIVVSSGNQDVGIEDALPHTKNPKGEQTKTYISNNRDIFEVEEKAQKIITEFPDFETLILLYYFDPKKNEIRLELSLPIDIDNGHISGWHKRIILPPISSDTQLDITRSTLPLDDYPNFEVNPKRIKQ